MNPYTGQVAGRLRSLLAVGSQLQVMQLQTLKVIGSHPPSALPERQDVWVVLEPHSRLAANNLFLKWARIVRVILWEQPLWVKVRLALVNGQVTVIYNSYPCHLNIIPCTCQCQGKQEFVCGVFTHCIWECELNWYDFPLLGFISYFGNMRSHGTIALRQVAAPQANCRRVVISCHWVRYSTTALRTDLPLVNHYGHY